jgi:hypothetical protein
MEMSGFESAVVDAAEMRGVGRREGFGQPLSKLICFFDDIAKVLEWKLEEKEKEKLLTWRSEDIRDLVPNMEVGGGWEGAGLIGGENFLCSLIDFRRWFGQVPRSTTIRCCVYCFFIIYISGLTSAGKWIQRWLLKFLFSSYCAVFSLDLQHLGLKAYSHTQNLQ